MSIDINILICVMCEGENKRATDMRNEWKKERNKKRREKKKPRTNK